MGRILCELQMLDTPTFHRAPYTLFTVEDAFSQERQAALEALFDAEVEWARHDDPLYRCFIAEVTERLDGPWLRALARRMAELTGLDLIERAGATVQRMEPGDYVDVHDDRPLLGFEAARLVLQLDRDWVANDGGLFRAFDGEEPVLERYPERAAATGIALSTASLHEVTCTRRTRHSVVFNFWHMANAETVERTVRGLFDRMSFGALPDAVARLAAVAEAERSEADTHRAASVAIALISWGYDSDEAAAGYGRALGASGPNESEIRSEFDAAVAIAGWLLRLHVEDFDSNAWSALRDRLGPLRPARYPRLREPWRVAFEGHQKPP